MNCKQCKQDLEDDKFLPVRRGRKVRICNDCAVGNMRKWAASQMVGKMPEEFEEK